jgi:hypothetical protein
MSMLLFAYLGSQLSAQSPSPIVIEPPGQQSESSQLPASHPVDNTNPQASKSSAPASTPSADDSQGRQTKRIMGIVPNFQAVSANTHLPPLSPRQKFWLATEGSFDYSSFISVGIQAGIEQATKTYPEFHQGAAGFGRYYWHAFADAGVENYLTGAILPTMTHEDPRYYTLYRGGFFHRTGYATSRLLITRNDTGAARFNFSEIFGSGVATVVSSRYYPIQERSADEILERWGSQLLNDGVGNVFQEFWPDINHKFFHRH